jgi:DNA polymerase-3 subunit epsilon
MFLFVDVETSGLIKKNLPLDDSNQPWVVSLAAQLCDSAGNELAAIRTGIRANGRAIAGEASAVHGISSRMASYSGVAEKSALRLLCGHESLVSQARYVVGHGLQFDKDVITGVILRNGWDASVWTRPGVEFCCTMQAATPFCKLKGEHDSGSYRWPSLDDACATLLNDPAREGAHDAWDDLQRCKTLFSWLRERGAFELEAAA